MSPPRNNALEPGYQLHWYEIRDVIGQGGFGVTYEARDLNLRRQVAIKEFFPRACALREDDGTVRAGPTQAESTTYEWGIGRFLEEARTLARLRHPRIVRVHTAFVANGSAYMVMDLESGTSLARFVEERRVRDEAMLLVIAHDLLDALDYLHERGYIHRDVKPDNVLVRADGHAVLIDFGSARQAVGSETRGLTSVVSRGYAPFEQYDTGDDGVRQGPWSDIYGLAATLHALVAGRPPVDALARGTPQLEGRPDPFEPLAGGEGTGFSESLLAAIDAGLAFGPRARPSGIAAWRSSFPPRPAGSGPAPAEDVPVEAPRDRDDAEEGAVTATPAGSPAGAAPRDESAARLRVLATAGSPFTLAHLQRLLTEIGVGRVYPAESAAPALEIIGEDGLPVDLMLCDLDLTGMDAIELLRQLGERGVDFPVAFLAGSDERYRHASERLARAHGLDVLASLAKPVRAPDLRRLVAEVLARRPAPPERGRGGPGPRDIDAGLAEGRLVLLYQPVVALRDGTVPEAEALARWHDAGQGLLGPGAFLESVRAAGRLEELTGRVLAEAAARARACRAERPDFRVSVNLPPSALADPARIEETMARLESAGVDPGTLVLEIGERALRTGPGIDEGALEGLRAAGAALILDDFGTVEASAEEHGVAGFGELKVDRSIVFAAPHDAEARAMLEWCAGFGHRNDCVVVAKGVESEEHRAVAVECGCDRAQGFHVSRPFDARALDSFVAARPVPRQDAGSG